MKNDIAEILLTKDQIADIVADLGAKITADYTGKNLLVASVLKGSYIFMADLTRHINMPCAVDFMAVSSYGSGTESSGKVQIIKDLSVDLDGYDLLLVEDIFDSGKTLNSLIKILKTRNPNSIKICTFLDKPERRDKSITLKADYVGMSVPDAFVVGYGLDYDEKYRNLPYLGILKPSVYEK